MSESQKQQRPIEKKMILWLVREQIPRLSVQWTLFTLTKHHMIVCCAALALKTEWVRELF